MSDELSSQDEFSQLFEQRLKSTLNKYLPKGLRTKCLIGVSGGLDSMTLLHIAAIFDVPATIIHINYHARGEQSDLDEALVRQAAEIYALPIEVFHADVKQLKMGNFQQNARDFRRSVFLTYSLKFGIPATLLAHHSDDQVETIIGKWFRGAGPEAMQGMRIIDSIPKENFKDFIADYPENLAEQIDSLADTNQVKRIVNHDFVRPFLQHSRSEIEKYAISQNIEWREDASNKTGKYARNWLRNRFSGALNRRFPGWRENVIKQSDRAAVTVDLIDVWFRQYQANNETLLLNKLNDYQPGTQRAFIAAWLRKNKINASEGEIEQVFGLVNTQKGSKSNIKSSSGDELQITRETNALVLRKVEMDPVFSNEFIVKKLPFEGETDFAKIRIKQFRVPRAYENHILYLDVEHTIMPLKLQYWQDGDKMKPLGMEGNKLISDVLTDHKITAAEKKQAIKVTGFDGKICAVIFPHRTKKRLSGCISDDCKVRETTKNVIAIQIEHRP